MRRNILTVDIILIMRIYEFIYAPDLQTPLFSYPTVAIFAFDPV